MSAQKQCGPIDPTAKDSFKYAVTYTDDYSNAIFVYFIRNKSDVHLTLLNFIADTSPFGRNRRMRTDNGGEFISGEFRKILIEKEIRHEKRSVLPTSKRYS